MQKFIKALRLKQAELQNNDGFTLVELLVVMGVLAVLLAITLVAINPGQHFIDSRNAQRQSNVVAILDAIYAYESQNNGDVPPSLSAVTTAVPIADATAVPTGVDLCEDIVPSAIADMPLDPQDGSKEGATCIEDDYVSGYTIAKTAANRFTVAAPGAEDSAVISVTR